MSMGCFYTLTRKGVLMDKNFWYYKRIW